MRPEEFYGRTRELRAFYIASEAEEGEHPCRLDTIRVKQGR